jgi:hypothetical protein
MKRKRRQAITVFGLEIRAPQDALGRRRALPSQARNDITIVRVSRKTLTK